jgi:hypothetical protein
MIERVAEKITRILRREYPAILLLGPRQCGKTTFARMSIKGRYFDLQKPSDAIRFADDPEGFLSGTGEALILDEAQEMPEIFPILRAVIDAARRKNGRFFLLGSVSPDLVKNMSESLAGRVGILELTPFLFSETLAAGTTSRSSKAISAEEAFEKFWFRGGFPDAFLAPSNAAWQRWHENYLRTFIERDVLRQGLRISPLEMRRFMGMLAHMNGGILNASDLGRSLGCSYHTIQSLLDVLEGYFLIRRLPPFRGNPGKRLVKMPRVYIRDSGVLHYLAGLRNTNALQEFPRRGSSFEGLMVEQIIAKTSLGDSGARFSYYRTHAGAEIDLIVEAKGKRTGYEFKCGKTVKPDDIRHLKAGIQEGIIQKGILVNLGDEPLSLSQNIRITPARLI